MLSEIYFIQTVQCQLLSCDDMKCHKVKVDASIFLWGSTNTCWDVILVVVHSMMVVVFGIARDDVSADIPIVFCSEPQ